MRSFSYLISPWEEKERFRVLRVICEVDFSNLAAADDKLSTETTPASAFTAPSAPENAPRTPSRWTALPRPGSWTPRPAWAAACAPPPAPKSA